MNDIKIICQNKKARHDYFIEETLEAGLILKGPEVKSLWEGKANLVNCYVTIDNEEAWLNKCQIIPNTPATLFNEPPMRKRKLLLHKKEIAHLIGKSHEEGLTLIPLKLYFKAGKVKMELAVAKGKKLHDKRATIKKREAEREIDKAMKSYKK